MNPIEFTASDIMNRFLPQVISDLGECHMRDLVSLYLDRRESPTAFEASDIEDIVNLCIKMNWGNSIVQ